ncbi:MAG: addiction module antidote protein [Rhodospirillaceae bacterium]|nr:addiction module antidote protein [Rhodospirillaceae bacterium]
MPKSRSHEVATVESFRHDPQFALDLLNDILRHGKKDELLVMLKYMTKAFGGLTKVASDAKLNPTTIYRTLSRRGNPELKSLNAILNAMGLRLAVQPMRPLRSSARGNAMGLRKARSTSKNITVQRRAA